MRTRLALERLLAALPPAGPSIASRTFAEDPDAVFAALEGAAVSLKRVDVVEKHAPEGRLVVRSRPLLFGSPATAWAHAFEIETGETQVDVGGDAALAGRLLSAAEEALAAARRG